MKYFLAATLALACLVTVQAGLLSSGTSAVTGLLGSGINVAANVSVGCSAQSNLIKAKLIATALNGTSSSLLDLNAIVGILGSSSGNSSLINADIIANILSTCTGSLINATVILDVLNGTTTTSTSALTDELIAQIKLIAKILNSPCDATSLLNLAVNLGLLNSSTSATSLLNLCISLGLL